MVNYETASQAAARLGVTVRAIQKWAKEGKIQDAKKIGRDWMIPTDAVRPGEKDGKSKKEKDFLSFPLMRGYSGLDFEKYISSLRSEEEKAMARCEYYYIISDFEKCTIEAEMYMDSDNSALRAMAATFCVFSNICKGHINKSFHAYELMKSTLKKSLSEEENKNNLASVILCAETVGLQLQLPVEKSVGVGEYIKFFKNGVMAYACYLKSYGEYMEKRYERALGISQLALNLCEDEYVISKIYLHLISSMSCINLLETEIAQSHIEEAYKLASPHSFIMPFVENYNLLGGLIENAFKLAHPEFYAKIIQQSKQYNSFLYEFYGKLGDKPVAASLTNTEFTIAMLYSRRWRVKEIASHLHLSERTVTNYISYIYDKLNINSKRELEKYMIL